MEEKKKLARRFVQLSIPFSSIEVSIDSRKSAELAMQLNKEERVTLKGLGIAPIPLAKLPEWSSAKTVDNLCAKDLAVLLPNQLDKNTWVMVTGNGWPVAMQVYCLEREEMAIAIAEQEGNIPKALTLKQIFSQIPEFRGERETYYAFDFEGKQRVFSGDNSMIWYLTEEQGRNYAKIGKTAESASYEVAVHDAEMDLYRRNIAALAQHMNQLNTQSDAQEGISVVDLGSGEGLKTTYLSKQLEASGRRAIFNPVDINEELLDVAKHNAEMQGLEVHSLHGDFEKGLPELVAKIESKAQRLLNLGGTTYGNFDSNTILSKVKSVMRKEDAFLCSVEVSDHDVEKIVERYNNKDVEDFAFGVVKNTGFRKDDVEFGVRFNAKEHRVEIYFTILNLPYELDRTRLKVGDELFVIKSSKPTSEDFESKMREYFDGVLLSNESGSFVGFLGWLPRTPFEAKRD